MALIKAEKTYNRLLKSKQAEVAQRVRASGLPVADFEFIDIEEDTAVITSLLYKPDHNFHFDFVPSIEFAVRYSPAEHTASSNWQGVGRWEFALQRVDWWLVFLRRELDTPDPWAVFFESVEPFNFGGDQGDNSEFTEGERDAITKQLEKIKTSLLDEGVKSDEDRHAIIDGMTRIEGKLAAMGRLDWRKYAIGALVELALIGYATPEGVRHAVNLLFGAAQQLLR